MDNTNHSNLDALIEQALVDEPMQPIPAGFHGRLDERLRIASIIDRERQRLRFNVITGGVLFVAVAFALVGLPLVAYFQGWLVSSVPGGMGFFDLAVSRVATLGFATVGTTAAVVAVGAVVASLAVAGSVLRLRASRTQ